MAGNHTRSRTLRQLWIRAARWFALGCIVLGFTIPLAWMGLASLKTNVDIHDPSKILTFTPTLENYSKVFLQSDYAGYVLNSLVSATLATTLSLVLGVPAAYAMVRFSLGSAAMTVLLARIVPGVSLLVPWYVIFSQLRLVGTMNVLVVALMFVAVPLVLYVMMAHFEATPVELEEAAQVDGLTAIGAFLRIALPLSIPGVATAGILGFIFSWNSFMFALVLSGASTKTLPVALFDFVGYASVDWGGLMAAAVVVTLPIILIAIFAQRYIVAGLTAGAMKG